MDKRINEWTDEPIKSRKNKPTIKFFLNEWTTMQDLEWKLLTNKIINYCQWNEQQPNELINEEVQINKWNKNITHE